jgi:hypothetical protein
LSLDSMGNPRPAPVKRKGGDRYSVDQHSNAAGLPQPPTGHPFTITTFAPDGGSIKAQLEFSFATLTAQEAADWRAAFDRCDIVVIAIIIDVSGDTELMTVKLCGATVSAAVSQLKRAAKTLKEDSIAFISASFAFLRALVVLPFRALSHKEDEEDRLVHAEGPKRLE